MIKRLVLKNFRNHKALDLTFDQPFVFIDGDNGTGKTSILESIYVLATTKSHRTSEEKDLIHKQEPFLHIKAVTENDKYDFVLTKNGKRASINGIEKRKISDFIGNLRVVMFAPEDLELIKGSPANRRQFMDLEWMQLDKSYLRDLNTYKQILKQRNSLLKRIKPDDDYTFLDILGNQLYDVGSRIMDARQTFIELINTYLTDVYQRFSSHSIKLKYQPDVSHKAFKHYLEHNQRQDILYQTTNAGPHRDDFSIDFNGQDAKKYASQGEQRLIVVSIKFALLKLIEDQSGKQVILLLDDVLSELDQAKQHIFLSQLPESHQIIMNSATPVTQDHIQQIHLKKEPSNHVNL